jgi:hypothetical protein
LKRETEIKLRRWLYHIGTSYFLCHAYLFVGGFIFGILDWGIGEIVITAPVLEELMRALSIFIGGYTTYLYTAFFGFGEFVDYLIGYNKDIGPVPIDFFIYRLVCVGAHFCLLFIQLFGYKMSRKYNSKYYFYLTFGLAVIYHYGYNLSWGRHIHNAIRFLLGL